MQSIADDPEQYPLLSPDDYPEAYERMQRLVDRVVKSPEIQYRDLFAYDDVKIIHDDEVLNAFLRPGRLHLRLLGTDALPRPRRPPRGRPRTRDRPRREAPLGRQAGRKKYGSQALLDFILLSSPVGVGDVIRGKIAKELLSLDYGRDQEAQSRRVLGSLPGHQRLRL